MNRAPVLIGFLALLAACTAATDDDEDVADDDDDGVEQSADAVSVAGRWRIPPDVKAAGATARFAYDDAPAWSRSRCAGGLKPGAQRLRTNLNGRFDPQISRIEGYACRQNTANRSRMSVHGTGRAVDIFIPKAGRAADNTKGDAVANYLVSNARQLGIQMVIWDRTRWQVGRGEAAYTGPHAHDDHIHAELTDEAAR
ncbi:MAG: hypothetical protein KF819_22755 [Labilithrix sp.]|nr:hypothetical protein [Labilithrix sp.]